MDVRRLGPDDWQLTRDLRLAALRDAPQAFGSTYASSLGRTEAEWRAWPRAGAVFAARGTDPGAGHHGLAGAWVSADEPDVTRLISMWVAPAARGHRVAARLVDAVADWARQRGSTRIDLEVAAGNEPALNAYLRSGFTVTDRAADTPGGTVMTLPLR